MTPEVDALIARVKALATPCYTTTIDLLGFYPVSAWRGPGSVGAYATSIESAEDRAVCARVMRAAEDIAAALHRKAPLCAALHALGSTAFPEESVKTLRTRLVLAILAGASREAIVNAREV